LPRIAGVDIPERKKIRYAMRYVHGIGPKAADDILAEAGIDLDKRASDLNDQELSQIDLMLGDSRDLNRWSKSLRNQLLQLRSQ